MRPGTPTETPMAVKLELLGAGVPGGSVLAAMATLGTSGVAGAA